MAVKIRLKRMGKIRAPFYRVVVMDSRTKRDGRSIEEIGKYHPTEQPSLIDIRSDRAQYWLAQGAQPTEAVEALLKVTGDWQKFKGIDGAEGTLQVKAPATSKKDLYEAALAASGRGLELKGEAAGARRRPAPKPVTQDAPSEPAGESAADAPAEASPAEAPASADADASEAATTGDGPGEPEA
ncbi:MAG: 30S ribosomal protein S16 [Dermatophilaceae bacterium]